MILETCDYATLEKLYFEQIQAESDIRTPEQIAQEEAWSERLLARIMEKYDQYSLTHKKNANFEKIKNFLDFAKILQKFTAQHTGWMQTTISENWHGIIKMRFQELFFIDDDPFNSRITFASIFERFRDVNVFTDDGQITIQIFENLYDVDSIDVVNHEQE